MFMKTIPILFWLLAFACLESRAQHTSQPGIPIAYWDFEKNNNRNTVEATPELQINTGNAFDGKFGLTTTTAGLVGNAAKYGNANANGRALYAATWSPVSTDPGIEASTYFQFTINTSGFSGISGTFDVMSGTTLTNYPFIGVNYSTDGGSTYTHLTSIDPGNNTWKTNLSFALPAAANNNAAVKIRIYGYRGGDAANSQMRIDNLTFFATATTPNAGIKTSVDEAAFYTGVTSGLTNTQYTRYGTFTVASGSTLVLGNKGIVMGDSTTAGELTIASGGILDCGGTSDQSVRSVANGTFTLSAGAEIIIRSNNGIETSVAKGSIQTTVRNFSNAANYTYGGLTSATQVTGNALPATVNNFTINSIGDVALTNAVTINNQLFITAGTITPTSNTYLFVNNSAENAIIGGSATSFINGPINRKFAANLTSSSLVYNFPVGADNSYMPFSVTTLTTGGAGPLCRCRHSKAMPAVRATMLPWQRQACRPPNTGNQPCREVPFPMPAFPSPGLPR